MKDPVGANLDRIQIIKGWLDAKAGCRKKSTTSPGPTTARPGADGKLPPVGNTVDVPDATCTNTHRRARADHGLDRIRISTRAHARVLLRAGDRDPDAALDRVRRQALQRQDAEGSPDDTQERAYTSPIWYTPAT